MKFKIYILFLLSLQVVTAKEITFGKVSKEEVLATQHKRYPDANAAILYKSELVHFDFHAETGWQLITEVQYRIKIYRKAGLSWATLHKSFLTNSEHRQDIYQIKGFTFNIVDGNVVRTKLENEGVFIERVNDDQSKLAISMPNVKEGSVVDVAFKIKSHAYWNIDEFWLQFDIPVDFALVQLKIPEYFVYKQYNRGFYPVEMEQSQRNKSLEVVQQADYSFKTPTNVALGKETINYIENIFTFTLSNLPGLVAESEVVNINDYRAAIKFELGSTRFPNETYKNYSLTWGDVAKTIYDNDRFGKELNRHDYFKGDLKKLLRDASSEMERAMVIYDFVKSQMNWNYGFGILCNSKGIAEAYNEKKGNVADINLMLTSMFRYAGLKADPVLISSKTNGIPFFPTVGTFNYVVVGLQMGADLMLFDATEKYGYPDFIPLRAVNWVGRLIREDGTTAQIDLKPKFRSLNAELITVSFNKDGSITGKYRYHSTGYFAFYLRKGNSGNPSNSYLVNMEKRFSDMEITNFQVLNHNNPSQPLEQTYGYTKKSAFETIGRKIVFTPFFNSGLNYNPYKAEERNLPIEKVFTQSFKKMATIKVPDGYAVESFPEPVSIVLPKNMGSYKYEVWIEEDIIKINSEINWNTTVIPPEFYSDVKGFYDQIGKWNSGKLIFTKQ